jgi:dTDP-4-amino-4,6-dideoxygalactose transaminase
MIQCALPLAQYVAQRDAILAAVTRVLDSGDYILGGEVAAFETEFGKYCGAAHAVGVGSGTDALILALRALDIGAGDEVITVSHTALATVAAALAVGATPVLVDVDPVFYTIDTKCLAHAISPRTKAVIAVHLYGQAADMCAIQSIARDHGLAVVEDCAQAAGGTYKGRRIGSLGDIACFSFYPTKNLGALGDAGMVVTSDDSLAVRVRRLRQYGWDSSRKTREPGLNSRLDELQAGILRVKLPELDTSNRRRYQIAQRYDRALSDLPVTLPTIRADSTHAYHLYVIQCSDRDRLKDHLAAAQIRAGIHYPAAAHQHGGYDRRVVRAASGLAVTESLVTRILTLPLYPEMEEEQVMRVIQVVRSHYV